MRPALLGVVWLAAAAAVCGAPKKKDRKGPPSEEARAADHLAKARQRLDRVHPRDPAARTVEELSRHYISRAGAALAGRDVRGALALSEAADALSRAIDHMGHAEDPNKTDFPARAELSAHLESVYLHVRQADYFQGLSKDAKARTLVKLAREFYQRARRAYDRQNARETDEYTKTADELVKCLEHLAHAATPAPQPPRLK